MAKRLMESKNVNKYLLIGSYILSFLITIIVYYTGGTSKVYAHLMYIPIAIVSSRNGKKIGMMHAFFSAFLLGPSMPLNVELNQFQPPINWIIRLLIYVLIAFIIGFFSDFDKKHREYITNLLTHDIVTDLKNLESLRRENIIDGKLRTIIALSIKGYEDTLRLFGYNFTNKAIFEVSQRIQAEIKKFDNVELFRNDGIEFILVITHNDYKVNIYEIMDSLKDLNKSTIKVNSIPIYVETIIGFTKIKGDTLILEGIRQSLIALRYALVNDIKLKEFDFSLDEHYKNIVDIAANFKTALSNNNIKAAYQNIYNSNSEEVEYIELLARWIYDDGTHVSPGEFIEVIENTELISELTKFMIDNAIKKILTMENKNIVISINFSPKDFNSEVVNYLIEKIKKNGLNFNNFEVEITEQILLKKADAIEYLNILKNHGVKIALDDFGTGYSSYQQISEIPLDVIKIDKSIIMKICENLMSRKLAESIVYLCKYNNITIVAEGVETKEIANACKEIGIDLLQGYYYHKPTIIDEM